MTRLINGKVAIKFYKFTHIFEVIISRSFNKFKIFPENGDMCKKL